MAGGLFDCVGIIRINGVGTCSTDDCVQTRANSGSGPGNPTSDIQSRLRAVQKVVAILLMTREPTHTLADSFHTFFVEQEELVRFGIPHASVGLPPRTVQGKLDEALVYKVECLDQKVGIGLLAWVITSQAAHYLQPTVSIELQSHVTPVVLVYLRVPRVQMSDELVPLSC